MSALRHAFRRSGPTRKGPLGPCCVQRVEQHESPALLAGSVMNVSRAEQEAARRCLVLRAPKPRDGTAVWRADLRGRDDDVNGHVPGQHLLRVNGVGLWQHLRAPQQPCREPRRALPCLHAAERMWRAGTHIKSTVNWGGCFTAREVAEALSHECCAARRVPLACAGAAWPWPAGPPAPAALVVCNGGRGHVSATHLAVVHGGDHWRRVVNGSHPLEHAVLELGEPLALAQPAGA